MRLVIVEDSARAALSFADAKVRIGRAIDNHVRLSGKLVSRHHCEIELENGRAWLVDLGSANGTTLNGRRAKREPLAAGDEIGVGHARIRVEDLPLAGQPRGADGGSVGAADGPAADSARDELGLVGLATETGDEERGRASLVTFARIASHLARESELAPLLSQIVDEAVALVHAERGFLLLAGDSKDLAVAVARNFDRTDVVLAASRFSEGIASQVLRLGKPVLSVDAGRDERFSAMQSVEDLRLRSVLCLPIQVDGRVEGVLLLDNRLQQGAFGPQELELVTLFAVHAGAALRSARLLAELKAQNQKLADSRLQVERLNEQLGRKLRDRDAELAVARAELGRGRGRHDYGAIVGSSEAMRAVFAQLDRIVDSELPVLIRGESGTGKELIARAIHSNGRRRERPFLGMNCAALPDTLLESELFGHVRGAFTGADRAKKGLLEQAEGGTLFLDEIGDMSAEMQKKLLRVLQESEVRPLGGDRQIRVDVRLVAASHRDLAQMVARGEFREDLYYRINVLALVLPPLRERGDDVALLAESLLARAAREAGRPVPVLAPDALLHLAAYPWPGNVRELENEMRRLVVLAEDVVRPEHLSAEVRAARAGGRPVPRAGETADDGPPALRAPAGEAADLRDAVARYEREAIRAALERCGGNKSRASAELGISRFALQRKLEKYGMLAGDGG
jgi:transcriptional regulator with GAF, ATPase, and Fis domain